MAATRGQAGATRRFAGRSLPGQDDAARYRGVFGRQNRYARPWKARRKSFAGSALRPSSFCALATDPEILHQTTSEHYDLTIIGAERKGTTGLYGERKKLRVIKAIPSPVLLATGACKL